MALAVRADEQQPFVGIEFLAEWRIGHVLPQIRSCLEKRNRLGAALKKVIQGLRWGPSPLRYEFRWSLRLARTIGNYRQDGGINFGGVAICRSGRGFHYIVLHVGQQEVFRDGDVFKSLGDGPAVRGGFVFQLSFGKALGGGNYAVAGLFEILHGAIAICRGERLGERCSCKDQQGGYEQRMFFHYRSISVG